MSDVDTIAGTLLSVAASGNSGARPAAHLTPIWRISVNGANVSDRIRPRFVSLHITDDRANDADEIELVVSDHDGAVQLPDTGDTVEVAIGWRAEPAAAPYRQLSTDELGFPIGLVDKGRYTVQAVEYTGTPDTITIRARAANLLDTLRGLRDQSWHDTTVGAIVTSVAKRNGIEASIDKAVAARKVKHADQLSESDASFLRRLAQTYDCICTVKSGKLLFSQARAARTPSGKQLPPVTIVRVDGDQHRWSRADRDSYSGVRAMYTNIKTGNRSAVVAGISGRAKELRTTFASREDALAAARAEWLRIQRGIFAFEITLAYGRADLTPQRPVRVAGYKPQIDATPWIITCMRHTLDGGGYASQITLETEQAEGVEGQEGAGEE
ncbi:contractile injection system protein, VgrG/Pvc8 family [Variovorax sp. CY25R-8]|uniref:contractile injection system protein, VgrG/Pvc8 family n=1 Tax=Variovorax sp. CY25R-8 TaxID=2855501 RepID=UPI0021BB19BE|nr:contractile injection system protein, VgrG/Pvc8 family [Variovorax sp. CY25R-8]MCT8178121.1 late control protein [Variovorax sp. CY25R-8]